MQRRQFSLHLLAMGALATGVINVPAFADSTQEALNRSGYPTYGNENAKVNLVEFFDPACETCRVFHPHIKNIVDNSDGKVKLTLRYATLHQGSDQIVLALEAARLQGKYWPALEGLFKMQDIWASHTKSPDPELIWKILERTGVDIAKAKTDMTNPAVVALVNQDALDVTTLTITKTPGYFVNGKPLVRFGLEELKALIQAEVKVAYPN